MELSKEQIQEVLKELGSRPMFSGSDVFLLFGEAIETHKINSLLQLILNVFDAGQNKKIREVKQVLNIVDPRI